MPIGIALSSPATLLYTRLIKALLPQIDKEPINWNADDKNYEGLNLDKINT